MVAIVSRFQWGARTPVSPNKVALSSRRYFVIHWPASNPGADEAAVVRNIEQQHKNQGWSACPGYNFLVGMSGTVFEGCGRDVRGVHSPPRNTDGFGVCVLQPMNGNPSQAALNSTRALYDQLCRETGRTLAISWHGADYATACPGPQLTEWARGGMKVSGAPPPLLPEEEGLVIIVTNPNNNGQAILNLADGTYRGLSSPDLLTFYRDNGVPTAKRQPTREQWAKFRQVGTI